MFSLQKLQLLTEKPQEEEIRVGFLVLFVFIGASLLGGYLA